MTDLFPGRIYPFGTQLITYGVRPIRQVEIIAHRGLHTEQRENTLAAFESAVAAGAGALELDVHATRDGILVVHHDPVVRTADGFSVDIASSTLESVKSAALSAGIELSALDDVLIRFNGRAKLYIEVKALGIELLLARAIRPSTCELAVHAFDHRVVRKMRDFVPGLQTGLLTVSRPINPGNLLREAGASDYWPHADFVDEELVDEIHEAGGRVIPWTANGPVQWQNLAATGVDGICTDRPDLLKDWLSSAKGV